MAKNIWAIVGVVVVLLIVIGAVIYSNQNSTPSTVSTSTPISTGTNTQNSQNNQPSNTNPTPQAGSPSVVTSSSAIPADTSVVVSGTVNPNGAPTQYWFEYGKTSDLGSKTSTQTVGSGFYAFPTNGYITGLVKSTTYYYRLVAKNSFGQVAGSQYSFQTTSNVPSPIGNVPTVRTSSASDISRNGVTLNGNVIPNRADTNYWFEYGTTRNFGNTTALQDVGSGTANATASTQVLNLNPLTTYYFRLNAENQFGTVIGGTYYFKTTGPAAPTQPTATTVSASAVKSDSATLRATLNPKGLETSYSFQFSTDPQLASAVQTSAQTSAGSGVANVSVSASATGLSTSTTYYFRVTAQNSAGNVVGNILSFKTKN